MKIAIAGGTGIEGKLVPLLKGHLISLVGSRFDLQKEKFTQPSQVEFTAEYLTHNYRSQFSDYDLYLDCSENLKSKFIINDFSVKNKKKSILLFYKEGWKIFIGIPQKACFYCLSAYEKPLPPFLNSPLPEDKAISVLLHYIENTPDKSILTDLKGNGKTVEKSEGCPVCDANPGHYPFMNGEMADIVSVSCGDNSVSITPMNTVSIDLKQYHDFFASRNNHSAKDIKIVKENSFFLEFRIAHLNAVIFRQGRLIVKGTKNKNTALNVYIRYIGS